MKGILFVDDENNILEGLQRMLFPLRKEWNMAFASSGVQALEMMETQHFDVIVSDMRMPGMDGATLLGEVKRRFPDTLRFALTGQSDSETIYRSVGDAHQFLTKPCKPAVLKECIDKALSLKELLANRVLRSLVTQLGSLPPVPEIYTRLCEELKREESSVADVGLIIESDPAMTAKILQLVNSAFFGAKHHISTVKQAATLLGLDTIKALVLATGLFSYAGETISTSRFSIEGLRQHCLEVAFYAQAICRAESMPKEVQDEAYTAGLLHDAGMLIMYSALRGDYDRAHSYAEENDLTLPDAERVLFECTHSEVGAYLIGIWGLPRPIIEAVAYHHRPIDCAGNTFTSTTAVHVADVCAISMRGEHFGYIGPTVDRDYLRKLGLEARLTTWEAACLDIHSRGGQ